MTEPTVSDTPSASAPKGDRIAKLLARAGVASRREIERMIADGRVALDGVVLDTPATILSSLRGVTVDGDPVAAAEAARLFIYHKPTGLLVTERDPAGRPTIYDRLPADLPRTVPVGRLDLNTEGLLLLTTDGGLKRQLELPATGVERTYRARAYGTVTQAMLEDLIDGIEIDGVRYGPIDANLERRTGANQWIEMTLTEGKNREVRRVLEHLGLQVGRLIRTRYGPFVLADLPPGEVGEVKQHDLVAFIKTLGNERRGKGADLQSPVTVEPRAKPARVAPPPAPTPRITREPDRALRRPSPSPSPSPSPWGSAPKTTGWGSRARPSRPADPAPATPVRGGFRAHDDRAPRPDVADRPARTATPRPTAPRSTAPRPAPQWPDRGRGPVDPVSQPGRGGRSSRTSDDRAPAGAPRSADPRSDAAPRGRAGRTATDPRAGFTDRARPDRARPDRDRPDRARSDRELGERPSGPRSAGSAAPARGGKGPAGGRGHPPRAPKGSPAGGRGGSSGGPGKGPAGGSGRGKR